MSFLSTSRGRLQLSVLAARRLPSAIVAIAASWTPTPVRSATVRSSLTGPALHDSFQQLAQRDGVLQAPDAALDRVMELPGSRRLAPVVDRDDRGTSEHV